MNEKYKKYKIYCYNHKRKPWRRCRHISKKTGKLLYVQRFCLCVFVFLEAYILFPGYKETIISYSRSLISIDEIIEFETKSYDSHDGKEGERKERGFFLNLKEGSVKFWEKEERSLEIPSD